MMKRLVLIVAVVLLVSPIGNTAAQDAGDGTQPTSHAYFSQDTLVFRGITGKVLQRTVTLVVDGDPITGLQIIRDDLVDADAGIIKGSDITVAPETVSEISAQQVFEFTIGGVEEPGHYTGAFEFRYDDQPGDQTLALNFDVTFWSTPQVDADVNSKNLTIFAEQPVFDFPYSGSASGAIDSDSQGEAVIYLKQSAAGQARIQDIHALSFVGAAGRSLPAHAVGAQLLGEPVIGQNDSVAVRVWFAGNNIRPGEYNGTLVARIENQPTAVEIPLKIQVKHGWLWPLMILCIGLAAAYLFSWWNSQGKELQKLVGDIKETVKAVNEGKYIPDNVRTETLNALRSLFNDIDENKPADTIRQEYDGLKTLISDTQATFQAFVAANLNAQTPDSLRQQVENLKFVTIIRVGLLGDLDKIKEKCIQGDYASLEAAQKELDEVRRIYEEVSLILKHLMEHSQGQGVSQADRDRIIDEIGITESTQLREVVNAWLREMQKPEYDRIATGGSLSAAVQPVDQKRFAGRLTLSIKRHLVLQGVGSIVTIVVYTFVLMIGWLTLYVNNPTFGSDSMDYVTLFLWGATLESFRGQTDITFATFKNVVK